MRGSKDAWYILQKDPGRLNFSNNANGVGPSVAKVIARLLLSGDTERLAGKSCRNDINKPAPGRTIEGFNVIPYRGIVEQTIADSGFDDPLAVVVPFDVSDCAPAEEILGSEQPPSCAREKR